MQMRHAVVATALVLSPLKAISSPTTAPNLTSMGVELLQNKDNTLLPDPLRRMLTISQKTDDQIKIGFEALTKAKGIILKLKPVERNLNNLALKLEHPDYQGLDSQKDELVRLQTEFNSINYAWLKTNQFPSDDFSNLSQAIKVQVALLSTYDALQLSLADLQPTFPLAQSTTKKLRTHQLALNKVKNLLINGEISDVDAWQSQASETMQLSNRFYENHLDPIQETEEQRLINSENTGNILSKSTKWGAVIGIGGAMLLAFLKFRFSNDRRPERKAAANPKLSAEQLAAAARKWG